VPEMSDDSILANGVLPNVQQTSDKGQDLKTIYVFYWNEGKLEEKTISQLSPSKKRVCAKNAILALFFPRNWKNSVFGIKHCF